MVENHKDGPQLDIGLCGGTFVYTQLRWQGFRGTEDPNDSPTRESTRRTKIQWNSLQQQNI